MPAYNGRTFGLQRAPGQIDCPPCAGAHQLLTRVLSPELLFPAAFEAWIRVRVIEAHGQRTNASYIAAKTERDYRVCAKALERYFGAYKICDIGPGELMDYQQARAANLSTAEGAWRCRRGNLVRGEFEARSDAEAWAAAEGEGWEVVRTRWAYAAGANCIRKEVALLVRILRAARLWGEEQEESLLRVRPEEPEHDRALTIEEQHRLLHVGASRAEFRMMYQYVIVALQTTAGTNEMRSLRLGDVFLEDRFIQIPRHGAKNPYRMRTIPLVTEDAVWALRGLVARAWELGAAGPADYLFPRQKSRTHYDASRPMSDSGLKKPWDALRRAAGLPDMRLYDLRHTGITRMAEAGVPLRVAMTFAGHMTERMQQRYEAICMASKRGWGEQVWGDSARQMAAEAGMAMAAMGARKPVASEHGSWRGACASRR